MHRPPALRGDELTDAISASMVELYARHYDHDHDRTTATTYINLSANQTAPGVSRR